MKQTAIGEITSYNENLPTPVISKEDIAVELVQVPLGDEKCVLVELKLDRIIVKTQLRSI